MARTARLPTCSTEATFAVTISNNLALLLLLLSCCCTMRCDTPPSSIARIFHAPARSTEGEAFVENARLVIPSASARQKGCCSVASNFKICSCGGPGGKEVEKRRAGRSGKGVTADSAGGVPRFQRDHPCFPRGLHGRPTRGWHTRHRQPWKRRVLLIRHQARARRPQP